MRTDAMPAPSNHHCSIIDSGNGGILIEGASGSGKTSLALGLIDALATRDRDAMLVCDDQAMLSVREGRLIAHAPETIRGKAEIRGYGIVDVPFRPATVIMLACRLVEDSQVERMPPAMTTHILGVELPLLELPARHEAQGIRIVLAWLRDADRRRHPGLADGGLNP